MHNRYLQIRYGSRDLSWFIRSSSGFMRGMTSYQGSSKFCPRSLRMLTRRMSGLSSSKNMICCLRKFRKFSNSWLTQSIKINNSPNSTNSKTATPSNLTKSNESGSTATTNYSSNTNLWARTTRTSKARATTRTLLKANTVKTREEWPSKSKLKCKASSMNSKISTMSFVKNMKKSESSTKESTKKTPTTPRKTTI